jgi:hypothetical protein
MMCVKDGMLDMLPTEAAGGASLLKQVNSNSIDISPSSSKQALGRLLCERGPVGNIGCSILGYQQLPAVVSLCTCRYRGAVADSAYSTPFGSFEALT